jgi:hypothetical protein
MTDGMSATQLRIRRISFDPSGVVRAITFHLLDEGKAHGVNLQSSEAVVHKLSQRINHLAISADQWAAMDNGQRLRWLLKQSHIVVKLGSSQNAMLSVRRWPALDINQLSVWK